MTWHLKDHELEKKLIKSFPNFVQLLNDTANKDNGDNDVTLSLKNKGLVYGNFYFAYDDLVDVEEYNPHEWNRFPQVKPPRNVWMRLEIFRVTPHSQRTYRCVAVFSGGRWCCEKKHIEIKEGDDVYFRPWEG